MCPCQGYFCFWLRPDIGQSAVFALVFIWCLCFFAGRYKITGILAEASTCVLNVFDYGTLNFSVHNDEQCFHCLSFYFVYRQTENEKVWLCISMVSSEAKIRSYSTFPIPFEFCRLIIVTEPNQVSEQPTTVTDNGCYWAKRKTRISFINEEPSHFFFR